MARPRKIDDYIVHRIADLFHYTDGLRWSELKQRDGWIITLADKRFLVTFARDVHCAVGEFLCDLKPKVRPRILRQIADALEGKSARKRKSGKADDIAKIREADRIARAKQRGLYKGDPPTFRQIATEYRQLTGFALDRRAVKDAGCSVRREPKSHRKKLPRRM
jgi:hypothetical protein